MMWMVALPVVAYGGLWLAALGLGWAWRGRRGIV